MTSNPTREQIDDIVAKYLGIALDYDDEDNETLRASFAAMYDEIEALLQQAYEQGFDDGRIYQEAEDKT